MWHHNDSPHGSHNGFHQQCMPLISGVGTSLAICPIIGIGVVNPPGQVQTSILFPFQTAGI